jgi:hypothetical protein
MKKLPLVLPLTPALAAGLAFAPRLAVAGGHHHRGPHGGAVFVGPVFVSPFVARPFFPHPFFFPRPFFGPVFVRPFVPFGVVATAPVVVYSSPAVVYAPPPIVYAPPPVAYSSPPSALAPPPMPTVIQYAHGRYELRGDGVTTPYTWVWIPNPPPPPLPPSAPPEQPQGTPPATPQSAPGAPGGRGQIYSWVDEQGVTRWTNAQDSVPEPYRAQAKQPRANRI